MDEINKKSVLITGVNGQIGRVVAELLIKDYLVYGTSIEPTNQTGLDFNYVQADITNEESLNKLPRSIGSIVHCAAIITNNGLSNVLIDVNCKGVQNIASYALDAKCGEFIYFSSLPIIGKPSSIPITEDHPILNPPTVYHATKYFGEIVLKNLLKGINLSIFRIPSPIGRGTPANKIVPVFVKNAIENRDYTLLGTGSRIQNYIDVRDIARAVRCAIIKESNGIYNIASTRSYSNKEVAEICIGLFNATSKILYHGIDKEEDYQWIISTAKAKRELGFEAIYSLEDTLKEIGLKYR